MRRSGVTSLTVYCGLSAASPQKDRKPSTPSNDNNRYQASSAPCFVGSQRLPITGKWFWVNSAAPHRRRLEA